MKHTTEVEERHKNITNDPICLNDIINALKVRGISETYILCYVARMIDNAVSDFGDRYDLQNRLNKAYRDITL